MKLNWYLHLETTTMTIIKKWIVLKLFGWSSNCYIPYIGDRLCNNIGFRNKSIHVYKCMKHSYICHETLLYFVRLNRVLEFFKYITHFMYRKFKNNGKETLKLFEKLQANPVLILAETILYSLLMSCSLRLVNAVYRPTWIPTFFIVLYLTIITIS